MDDPIAALIRENPTPAVVHTPPSGSDTYNPSASYTTIPSPTDRPATNCLFSAVEDKLILVQHVATATFMLADFPAGVPNEATAVTIAGVTYSVVGQRKRMWRGAQNGWTLALG